MTNQLAVNHLPYDALREIKLEDRKTAAEAIVLLNDLGYFNSLSTLIDKTCAQFVTNSLGMPENDVISGVTTLRVAQQITQGLQGTAKQLLSIR
jgi:hypothetical protein